MRIGDSSLGMGTTRGYAGARRESSRGAWTAPPGYASTCSGGTPVLDSSWRVTLLAVIAAAALADEPYAIWTSAPTGGFEWQEPSSAYASGEACGQAIEGRRRRLAGALGFVRRIGADDIVLHAVGDRVYECRPAIPAPTQAK